MECFYKQGRSLQIAASQNSLTRLLREWLVMVAKTREGSTKKTPDRGAKEGTLPFASEEELVEKAKEDPVAFGILYERYVDRIYRYIFYRTGSHHDAEDLTARTFFRALHNIHRYTQRGVPFSAWLYRIAHNLVANWHRDNKSRQWVSLDQVVLESKKGNPPEHHLEQKEREEALRLAMRRLGSDRQELLILKFAEGLSNEEIGKIMGKSEGAIKSLYHRVLVALREDLQSQGF